MPHDPEREFGPDDPAPKRAPFPQAWWDLPLRSRRLVAFGVAATVSVVLVIGVQWIVGSPEPSPDRFVARLSLARVNLWDAIADCESGADWTANTGNGYYGGLQFSLESWAEVEGETRPDLASRNEQIMRAEMLSELQGFGAWPACADQLGLT